MENKGANIGVYSPTYDLNRLNLEPRFLAALDDFGLPYKYNKSTSIITVQGYGSIIFRSMDNPMKIIAYETFRAHIDEIDTLPMIKAEAVWNKVIARNRQAIYNADGVLVKNKVSAYSTPEGFAFTYSRWQKNPTADYGYIRAPTTSNPHLPEGYIQSLRDTYPAALIDSYIQGIWTNLTSGAVYPYFDRVRNHKANTVRKGEPLHIGLDFNKYHMAGIVFNDRFEIVDEFIDYADTPAICVAIKAKYTGHHITIYPDASGGSSRSTDVSVSDFSILRDNGFKILARKSNPRITDRVVSVNRLFEKGELFVDINACPRLTECIEQQVYDDNGEPDKKSGLDHALDGMGYRVAFDKLIQKPTFNIGYTR